MNPLHHPRPNGSLLTVLRQAIRQVGFREGMIVAYRHDGRIAKVKVSSAVHGCGRPGTQATADCTLLSLEQAAQYFLDRLDPALRRWAFRYGKFKFKVVNTDVVRTTFSVHIRPHEEGLMLPLCGGDGTVDGTEDQAPLPPKG